MSTLPAEEEESYQGEQKGGQPAELPAKYEWEQNVMVNNVMKSEKFTHAVIISVENGELRAAGPPDFRPNKKAIKHILAALKGDTAGIAEEGVNLGGGIDHVFTPGKLDEGKAIYCNDTLGGGCAIFKTKETVLIAVYPEKPAVSTRLAAEIAEYIEDEGGR